MIDVVRSAIDRHEMLRFGRRVGVAVSGGADSVFLLRTLVDLGVASAVIHINHQLRQAESDADEQFVRSLATAFRLPVFVDRSPILAGNVEQAARRARYAFFDLLVHNGAVDAVATGHTLDDQAETVLFRFLRGSGTAGLSGIRPVTANRIVRPLLYCRRDAIRAELTGQTLQWREDSSNRDVDFVRNRLRALVMPLIEPNALANTAELAQAEEDYWNVEINSLAQQHFQYSDGTVIFSVRSVADQPLAVKRRILRRAVEMVRGDLRSVDFSHIEAIRKLLYISSGSGRLQVPDVDVMRSFDWVRLIPMGYDGRLQRNFEAPLTPSEAATLPERGLAMRLEPATNPDVYNNQVNAFDQDLCAGSLLLRNWLPGDQIHCQGRPRPEKIKTLFQEFRIPLWERRGWPVIAIRNQSSAAILWAQQFGVSSEYVPCAQSQRVLIVKHSTTSQVTESKQVCSASIEMKRAPSSYLLANASTLAAEELDAEVL